jgi:hypothetical protein
MHLMKESIDHEEFVKVIEKEVDGNVEKAKRVLTYQLQDVFPEVAAAIN